mmetsp:Transcript_30708/g.71020  ORF Transcript_30708/g.71020 Transcript_30708/m.71020 type:complete len:385 (-) Transcript_30708:202-1356(-)|eukprot:CAMPEP_0182577912 /NCGR_PEP_ID=MMETSP1324-20130603/39331_1 /TAXON_ID=236786 /ORGANISM="Florenciella sp., Strain RCC1587" /LENGTH=384 /DNA_ID=CAMNT_0024793797 /DNA_START=110 /DNA_END=1264 /DNA_ORIENTATION=+
MSQSHQIVPSTDGITAHAWNSDRTELALSPNNNELIIFENCQAPMSEWRQKIKLTEHDLTISGIDWHPVTGMIVTCAHDRNAFVWTYSDGVWNPSLVILRIEYAAIDCKWSPDGRKFAVASGAKCVPVCHYEEENSWWVSKMIKKPHKSTVLCVAWHPNSQLIATGSSDFKCRLFSAYVEATDDSQDMGPLAGENPASFAEMYHDWSANGWVHCVDWSPSGNVLAFGAHDSSLHVVTFGGGAPVTQVVRFTFLPLCTVKFISDAAILGGGHDCNPAVFADTGAGWAFSEFCDKKPAAEKKAEVATSGAAAARAMFQNKTKTGQTQSKESMNDNSWQKHQSPVTFMQQLNPASSTCSEFSTTALDGRIAVWKLPEMDLNHGAMGL